MMTKTKKQKKKMSAGLIFMTVQNHYHTLQRYWILYKYNTAKVNPIIVKYFASLFNCTPAGRESDFMMAHRLVILVG